MFVHFELLIRKYDPTRRHCPSPAVWAASERPVRPAAALRAAPAVCQCSARSKGRNCSPSRRTSPSTSSQLRVRLDRGCAHEQASFQYLLRTLAGCVNRGQQGVIECLREESRILREHLGGRRQASEEKTARCTSPRRRWPRSLRGRGRVVRGLATGGLAQPARYSCLMGFARGPSPILPAPDARGGLSRCSSR